ncbi:MAG: LamG domain-containing protein, partial [Chthoniobacteraceae bacterium]
MSDVFPAEADAAAAVWHFDGGDALGAWQGKGHGEAAGPRAPIYPKFGMENRSAEFAGKDAALVVADAGAAEAAGLRFGKGDAITMEAWVKVRAIRDGQMVYLIGKGRNRTKEFGDNNQNYALRLKGVKGRAAIGFLFTAEAVEGQPASWHRWWSTEGFQIDTGWHHVALTYTFGQKGSLHGYIDGAEMKGAWDLGGATDHGPVSDGDALVIGSGYSRGPAETLDGWLDEVAIHRVALSAATLKERFAVAPAALPAVDRAKLPPGRVLVELCEKGVPEKTLWPVEPPVATESYLEDAFGFAEVPQKYI